MTELTHTSAPGPSVNLSIPKSALRAICKHLAWINALGMSRLPTSARLRLDIGLDDAHVPRDTPDAAKTYAMRYMSLL